MPRIVRIAALGFGLIGGVVASQGPEFAQQYRQRIGGAVDELRRVVERFDADAKANGETRESAIVRLRGSADDLASRQGVAMQDNIERLQRLELHRQTMREAGSFARLALLLRDADADLARATYQDFEPAVPTTEEGLISAAVGFAAAWGGVLLVAGFVRSLFRRPHHRRLKVSPAIVRRPHGRSQDP